MTVAEYLKVKMEVAETLWVKHVVSDSFNPSDLRRLEMLEKQVADFEKENPEYGI